VCVFRLWWWVLVPRRDWHWRIALSKALQRYLFNSSTGHNAGCPKSLSYLLYSALLSSPGRSPTPILLPRSDKNAGRLSDHGATSRLILTQVVFEGRYLNGRWQQSSSTLQRTSHSPWVEVTVKACSVHGGRCRQVTLLLAYGPTSLVNRNCIKSTGAAVGQRALVDCHVASTTAWPVVL